MLRMIINIVLLLSGIICVGCKSSNKITKAAAAYKSGVEAQQRHDHRDAFKHFSRAVRLNSNEPKYYLARAEERYKQWDGNEDQLRHKQIADYEIALSLALSRPDEESLTIAVHLSRMIYHYEMREYRLAIINSEYLIKRTDIDSTAYLYRCMSQLRLRDTSMAKLTLDSALKAATNDRYVYEKVAEVEYRMGLYKCSILHYQAAEKIGTISDQSKMNLSQIYWIQQKKDSACLYLSNLTQPELKLVGILKDIQIYCGTAER